MRKSHPWEEFGGRHLRILKFLKQERKSLSWATGYIGPGHSGKVDQK